MLTREKSPRSGDEPATATPAAIEDKSRVLKHARELAMGDTAAMSGCIHIMCNGRRCKNKIARKRRTEAQWTARQVDCLDFTTVKEETLHRLLLATHCTAHRNEVGHALTDWWQELQGHLDSTRATWMDIWHPYNCRWEQLANLSGGVRGRKSVNETEDTESLPVNFSLHELKAVETTIPWPTTDGNNGWMTSEGMKRFHLLSMIAVEPQEVSRNSLCHKYYCREFLTSELEERWLPLCLHIIDMSDLDASPIESAQLVSNLHTILRGLTAALTSCDSLGGYCLDKAVEVSTRLDELAEVLIKKAEALRTTSPQGAQETRSLSTNATMTVDFSYCRFSSTRWKNWILGSLAIR